ncbi:MAG: DUF5665 domain-containing protein [Pseudomonadota bacterium]
MGEPSEPIEKPTSDSTLDREHLLNEARAIRLELEKLRVHRLLQTYDSTPRLLWLMFLKGVAFGLGSFVGATIVVSIVIYLLGQIEFIPIIGEWVRAILDTVKQ